MTKALDDLRGVFVSPGSKNEGLTTTSKVLLIPDGISKDLASKAIQSLDLKPIMRDFGIIVAREIANELDAMALRPADFVDLPDLAKTIAKRLAAELAESPEEFAVALSDTLKMRG